MNTRNLQRYLKIGLDSQRWSLNETRDCDQINAQREEDLCISTLKEAPDPLEKNPETRPESASWAKKDPIICPQKA